jgi:hypothetical protein
MLVTEPLGEAPRLDGRTRLARRAKQLVQAFSGELAGDLSPAKAMQIRRAAELAAIAEHARTRRMAGDATISLDDIVRLDSAARRAVRDLDLPAPGARPAESLEAYLARTAQDSDEARGNEASGCSRRNQVP